MGVAVTCVSCEPVSGPSNASPLRADEVVPVWSSMTAGPPSRGGHARGRGEREQLALDSALPGGGGALAAVEEDREVERADAVVDDGVVAQVAVRVSLQAIPELEAKHELLRPQPVVGHTLAEDAGGAAEVVAGVRVEALATLVEDERVGMQRLPGAPGGERRGQRLERGAGELAVHGDSQELAPERVRLPVVHDQRVHDQLAGDAERELPVFNLSGIHDAREAERSPRDHDRFTADRVVHDLPVR